MTHAALRRCARLEAICDRDIGLCPSCGLPAGRQIFRYSYSPPQAGDDCLRCESTRRVIRWIRYIVYPDGTKSLYDPTRP